MIALENIDAPDLLRKHVRLAILEREYFKQRAKEHREELDRLKGLTPAEQLEFQLMKQAEHLAKLRHKIFGDSSERRPSPHPPRPRAGDEAEDRTRTDAAAPAADARGAPPTPRRAPARPERSPELWPGIFRQPRP